MSIDIRLGDCLDIMRQMPNDSIDLIITSPPYNLGSTHHTGDNRFSAYTLYNDDMPESDYQKWQIDVLNECHRLLKPSGSMWYNHKNRIKDGVTITPYEWILRSHFIVKQEVVWFNRSQNFDKIRFYPMTERVYWLVKNKDTKLFNAINHHDVFEWKSVGTKSEHKRQFPEEMVSDIIACFKDAQTVLDPFMGSGTVGAVCYDMHKDFIGIEIDPTYYELANKRLNDEMAQIRMF